MKTKNNLRKCKFLTIYIINIFNSRIPILKACFINVVLTFESKNVIFLPIINKLNKKQK
jgi:hypothetical protein